MPAKKRKPLKESEIRLGLTAVERALSEMQVEAQAWQALARKYAPATGHGPELLWVMREEGKLAKALRDSWWVYLGKMCANNRPTSRPYRAARAGFDICVEAATLGTPAAVVARQLSAAHEKAAHAERSARRGGGEHGERAGEALNQKIRDIVVSLGWSRTGKRGEIAALVLDVQNRFPPQQRKLITRDRVRRAIGLRA